MYFILQNTSDGIAALERTSVIFQAYYYFRLVYWCGRFTEYALNIRNINIHTYIYNSHRHMMRIVRIPAYILEPFVRAEENPIARARNA